MGSRLSKITTRTGDSGETGLGDGRRVAKDSARVVALGDVDELNSALGVLLACGVPADVRAPLIEIQHDLFDLGGELSIPGYTLVTEVHIARLEEQIERFNAPLAPLKEFILPAGVPAAAHAHVARAICRRAERSVVSAAREETVSDSARIYLNRLSDLLFILARHINRAAGAGDVLWSRARP